MNKHLELYAKNDQYLDKRISDLEATKDDKLMHMIKHLDSNAAVFHKSHHECGE